MSFSKTQLLMAAGLLCGIGAVTAEADTLAYWRMEGTAGNNVPGGTGGAYTQSVNDESGNGNHLSVWGDGGGAGFIYNSDVSSATVPQTGAANTTSMKNTGGGPAAHTHSGLNPSIIGQDVEAYFGNTFTLEVSYKPELTDGHRTFLGRDGINTTSGDGALANIYFQLRPDETVAFNYSDAQGFRHGVETGPGAVTGFVWADNPNGDNPYTPWYDFAVTSDGTWLRLYIDGVEVASTDMSLSGSGDTSLAQATGDGGDWRANAWTVGRGLYNGGHGDRAYGFIDEVRISDEALAPNQLLANVPEPGSIALLTLGGLLVARRRRA